MSADSHENLIVECNWEETIKYIKEKCKPTFTHFLERWRDERLCNQPLNCLSMPFVENKLRGGKDV